MVLHCSNFILKPSEKLMGFQSLNLLSSPEFRANRKEFAEGQSSKSCTKLKSLK